MPHPSTQRPFCRRCRTYGDGSPAPPLPEELAAAATASALAASAIAGALAAQGLAGTLQVQQAPAPYGVPAGPGRPQPGSAPPADHTRSDSAVVASADVSFSKARIIYRVTVRNGLDAPIARVRIDPDDEKSKFKIEHDYVDVALMDSGASESAEFRLIPQGEFGVCRVTGKVSYYEVLTKQVREIAIRPITASVQCPRFSPRPRTEEAWRADAEHLLSVEEQTEDVPVGGSDLFAILTDVVEEMGLYKLPPKITNSDAFFRGKAYFSAADEGGDPMAVKLEILGGPSQSKLIVRTLARTEEDLAGLYHRLLDEIGKRLDIRRYLAGVTVRHIHGDYIAGSKVTVQDSVIQDSNLAGHREGPPPGSVAQGGQILIQGSVVRGGRIGDGQARIVDSVVQDSEVGTPGAPSEVIDSVVTGGPTAPPLPPELQVLPPRAPRPPPPDAAG